LAPDFNDLRAFVAVAQASSFRGAARSAGVSPSGLSEAVTRLEARLGVRLLNRTTRSVVPTEAGARLLEHLNPAFIAIAGALDAVNSFRDKPAGTLKLNVPVSAARLVLPSIIPPFLTAYPDIRVEVMAEDGFVDILAAGFDAGIRYDERLELDMIAVPIGPRVQRFAAAASSGYLERHPLPSHPRELLDHKCLASRFHGRPPYTWEFEREGEFIEINPPGQLTVSAGTATDLAIEAAIAGLGIIYLFEDWLRPHLERGALKPVLEPWWQTFSGPFLYYPGRRLVPAPLRAFIDFIKARGSAERSIQPR
jgi:DNA-binding transcriptional LysR family regulator